MRCKRWIILSFAIVMITVFRADGAEELVRIDNTGFAHPRRSAAVFDHDEHNEKTGLEEDCSFCHHVYENRKRIADESSEDSKCDECHAVKANLENSISLRIAFHKRCKACHFESNKGPVLCGECHVRK